jgi:putative ATP-dependent endonuclease of the OLD family
LDVRASDLLQANGIVWVEGPSDRLYVNRWIELETDGLLKEGTHYQCVYYGGRLLAHLSADSPDVPVAEVVQILRVNRNAAIIIDSDRENETDRLSETKERLLAEIADIGGVGWVTDGREIENYLPLAAIKTKHANALAGPGRYVRFLDYLENMEPGAGRKFTKSKVLFAEAIVPAITKESLSTTLDLVERLKEVVAAIRSWNGI